MWGSRSIFMTQTITKHNSVAVELIGFRDQKQKDFLFKLLNELAPLFPHWVKDIEVRFVSNDEVNNSPCLAEIAQYPEYKLIRINLFCIFFEDSEEKQRDNLIHELAHTTIGIFTTWVRETLLPPFEDINTTLHEVLKKETTYKLEAVTQELTETFKDLLEAKREI